MNDLRATLAALPIPVLAIDPSGRICAANTRAADLLGNDMTGRHFATALRQPAIIVAIEAAQSGAGGQEAPFVSSDHGVEMQWRAMISKAALSDEVVIVSFLDETSQADADTMRREFVANVSHELKTPLTALLGFIETLQGPARNDPTARDTFLEIMAREAGRMDRLTQDLLSLSRVERDERRRPDGRVPLGALVATSVQAMTPVADGYGVTIEIQEQRGLDDIPGDADQLAQVLSNLIENAIKYGRKDVAKNGAKNGRNGGVISVTLSVSDSDPRLQCPVQRVDVTDQGEGIEAHHLARLTERFYRVDSHRSRAVGGTGLGLAIAKHIVNRHRGRLGVASTPGEGSRFSIILPAR
ncbi:MAG: two-component sensor histidine kinase [Rhodobacteraceae bacterium]|nr:two-component sensor histidine kinase [Paracoccaceae bacterium]